MKATIRKTLARNIRHWIKEGQVPCNAHFPEAASAVKAKHNCDCLDSIHMGCERSGFHADEPTSEANLCFFCGEEVGKPSSEPDCPFHVRAKERASEAKHNCGCPDSTQMGCERSGLLPDESASEDKPHAEDCAGWSREIGG